MFGISPMGLHVAKFDCWNYYILLLLLQCFSWYRSSWQLLASVYLLHRADKPLSKSCAWELYNISTDIFFSSGVYCQALFSSSTAMLSLYCSSNWFNDQTANVFLLIEFLIFFSSTIFIQMSSFQNGHNLNKNVKTGFHSVLCIICFCKCDL